MPPGLLDSWPTPVLWSFHTVMACPHPGPEAASGPASERKWVSLEPRPLRCVCPAPTQLAATRASRTCSWPLNTVQLHSPGPGRLGVWDQRTGEYRPICLRKDFKGQDVLPSGSPSKSLWVHEVTLLPVPGPPQQGAVSGFTRLLQLWPPCEG